MANVPATILSRYYNANHMANLVIGSNTYPPNADTTTSFYWYTVVDLTNLKVVDQAVSTSNNTVPANIAKYVGNAQYFLFFAANSQRGYNIPQGGLYTFLTQVGSGYGLTRGEQMIEQLGTGSIINFSYVLAATFTTTDLPGFELFSPEVSSILTMEFMPVVVNGVTTYVPIQPGPSGVLKQ